MKDIVIAGFFFRQSAKDFLIRLRQLFCLQSNSLFECPAPLTSIKGLLWPKYCRIQEPLC